MCSRARGLERVMGIEPTFSAWEADVLPLNYTRMDEPKFYRITTASQRRRQGGQGVSLRHGRSATGAGWSDRRSARGRRSATVRGVAQIGSDVGVTRDKRS
jgi:hypothetical protein